jgi:HSP20 family protein
MTLVRVNPGRKVKRPSFFTDFDRMFDEFLKGEATPRNQPAANVIETGDGFHLQLATPGLGKEDLNLKVEKEILSIFAEIKNEAVEGEKVRRREFNYSTFKRSFHLPETVDASRITASYEQGILNVFIPKKEEAKELPPRNIEIK